MRIVDPLRWRMAFRSRYQTRTGPGSKSGHSHPPLRSYRSQSRYLQRSTAPVFDRDPRVPTEIVHRAETQKARVPVRAASSSLGK